MYCEIAPHQPYVIRKIEELTKVNMISNYFYLINFKIKILSYLKTPCGNVEAKVICAFRRQDIPASILASIEKYQSSNLI